MKLKRLELTDFRNFRGDRSFDFTDPATGAPRNLVVLVGSNGCGKTSLFEIVYALLGLVDRTAISSGIFREAAFAHLTMEIEEDSFWNPGRRYRGWIGRTAFQS
ncbi:MAG: AAA family ATPase [Deltaproteobacteria bacterium]|nr:AAA family ATPase [Deltaproteobacteria bacterium]